MNQEAFSGGEEQRPTMSPVARIFGVFLSPRKTFEDINRRPDWLIPMIVILLVALATMYVFLTHADVLELMKRQIESRGRPVPPDEQLEGGLKLSKIFSYVGVGLGVPLIMVVVAGILFAVFNFVLGTETTFRKVFAVEVYASLIGSLKGLLAIPILFVKQPPTFGNPADVLQSNLSLLFDDTSQKALFTLGKQLDVFTLWYLVVLSVGLSCVSRNLPFKKALTTSVVLWAIVVIIAVAWASLSG